MAQSLAFENFKATIKGMVDKYTLEYDVELSPSAVLRMIADRFEDDVRKPEPSNANSDYKPINLRPAKLSEIVKAYGKRDYRLSYEHGAQEVSDSRTETGVRHITRTSSMVRMINGIPHVKYRGELRVLYAEVLTTDSGRETVCLPSIYGGYAPE